MHTTGSNYEATKHLDIAQIAKLIRRDLRATLGKSWKVSVRIERYSMGRSILAAIKEAPVVLFERNPEPIGRPHRHSAAGELALKTIDSILDSYNYDNSDPMTDYFDRRFWGRASIDFGLERRQTKALAGARGEVAA